MSSLDPTAPATGETSRQADVEQGSPEPCIVEEPASAPDAPPRTPPETLPASEH